MVVHVKSISAQYSTVCGKDLVAGTWCDTKEDAVVKQKNTYKSKLCMKCQRAKHSVKLFED